MQWVSQKLAFTQLLWNSAINRDYKKKFNLHYYNRQLMSAFLGHRARIFART
ncbi:hypothetical protein ACRRTK_009695 [Alexandromys fortis]